MSGAGSRGGSGGRLDGSLAVGELLERHPETGEVFNAYGIDTLLSAGDTVEAASRAAGVDPALVLGDLEVAIRLAGA